MVTRDEARPRGVVVVGLLWASPGFSQNTVTSYVNGNKLYDDCSAQDANKLFCFGYVAAVSDALWSGGCHGGIPHGVPVSRAADVILKFLRDHPEYRHLTAFSLSKVALEQAFPCKEQAH
jgi:hypothetical protein